MNKMPSDVAGGLRRAPLDCETVATPRLRDVSHELHIEDIEDDVEEIICPPSQMLNFSGRQKDKRTTPCIGDSRVAQRTRAGPITQRLHIEDIEDIDVFEDIKDMEDIEDDVEEIICPPSQMSNCSDRPNTLPQLFNCGTAFSEEVTEERRLSLGLFIKQLVAHIEKKSHTPTSNVDLSKLEAYVRLRIPFNLRFTHPKAFDKVLIPIYNDLCQQFGSKYLVLAAMNSGDVAFEAAVAEGLKTRLTASAQEPDNLVKRVFFKRSVKVALLSDVKPRHTEENSQSDRTVVSTLMNRKGDGFGKRLSSIASVVKTLATLPPANLKNWIYLTANL